MVDKVTRDDTVCQKFKLEFFRRSIIKHWVFIKGGLHKLRQQARGEGGLAKCLCYYISLCSKLADGGGRGGQKLEKSC